MMYLEVRTDRELALLGWLPLPELCAILPRPRTRIRFLIEQRVRVTRGDTSGDLFPPWRAGLLELEVAAYILPAYLRAFPHPDIVDGLALVLPFDCFEFLLKTKGFVQLGDLPGPGRE